MIVRQEIPVMRVFWMLISCLCASGCMTPVIASSAPARNDSTAYLLHLPGVAGEQYLDREMLRGLRQGGFDGAIEVYDWAGDNPGFNALMARKRNKLAAMVVAEKIEAWREKEPDAEITLVAHSGGAGIAVWALENLPEETQVDTVMLLAPALSPSYDLSESLRQVRGKCYVFSSIYDVLVLGLGTKLFGTIDRMNVDAAGRTGFRKPKTADAQQYKKIVNMPYDVKWMKYANIGDHIGWMSKSFARHVLAPLVKKALPLIAPATRPSTRPAASLDHEK